MNYKVFFAYQSDIEEIYGKRFIIEAFDIVIPKFKKDGIIIELDYGMRKTSGNPLLINEMLRKSQESDLVIVDLTFTSAKEWLNAEIIDEDEHTRWVSIPKGNRKPSPNPNVLLETGYAWSQKGSYRTILLMNNAYGDTKDLPVDLEGFRWPILYNLDKDNYSEKKSIKIELANDLYNSIKYAINSESEYQREKWQPLRLHKDWMPKDYKTIYQPTNKIKQLISQLRIDLENTSIAQRIVGPKNSGKTRLAYELYKKLDEHLQKHENLEKVLYYDLEIGEYTSIENKLQDLKLLNQRKIVILDNCSNKIHKKVFEEYFYDTSISLLSIGNTEDGEGATHFVDKNFANDIIEKLSNETGNPRNTNFIVENSNSNIRNAIAMIGKIPEGETELSPDYSKRWMQIIGEDLKGKTVLSILEELSLFTHVGFYDRFLNQSEFIRIQSNIATREEFEKVILSLVDKGFVKVTGDFIILEVFVEELAFRRLERLSDENIEDFFAKITSLGLARHFSNRLVELNRLKGTQKLIDVISKENGLLSNFNFINSDQGAKIIMTLSEVEPNKILNALESVLKNKTNEELLKLKNGRRNVVWALERLAFRKITFYGAAKLLYKLAVSENENIGNNATSQFIHLFQILLPGTEATLEDRIKLLRELVKEEKENYDIINKALDCALIVHGFTRMGGADEQAGEKLIDYHPKTKKEIFDYWQAIIELLIQLDSFDILVNRLNSHVHQGDGKSVLNAIELMLKKENTIDKSLRQQFEYLLNDEKDVSSEIREQIQVILKQYSTGTVQEKLEFLVSKAPYSSYKLPDGTRKNRSEEKAYELAKELTNSGDDWLVYVDVLLQDEQRLTFSFGKSIANFCQEDEKLIVTVIDKLSKIPFENQNNSFIEGYLSEHQNKKFIRDAADKYLANNEVAYHALRLTRLIDIQFDDLKKLYPIIEANPKYVVSLQYLSIKSIDENDIVSFAKWLDQIEPYGNSIAIDLLESNFGKEKHISSNLRTLIKSLLMSKGFVKDEGVSNTFWMHQYVDLVNLLDLDGLDDDLVEFLANQIIENSKEFNFRHEHHFKDILNILFSKYWDISWSTLAKKMMESDYYGWFNLKDLLQSYPNYNYEQLLKWMKLYPKDLPQKIIEIIPFSVNVEGEEKWHPLILEMFDCFFENESLFSHLSSRLHSYFWSGSVVPLLESRKKLIEQLTNHSQQKVREFAAENIIYYEDQIKREKRNDENQKLMN